MMASFRTHEEGIENVLDAVETARGESWTHLQLLVGARQLAAEVRRLWVYAGGGRCVECGQVESITANGRLAPHYDTAIDDICEGSGLRDHEPPNLTVRVLDNDDRKELERLRGLANDYEAERQAADEAATQLDALRHSWGY